MEAWIGYQWLAERYAIPPVQPFRVDSQIGGFRGEKTINGIEHRYCPTQSHPGDSAAQHLAFALRTEGIHLEFLSRLFVKIDPSELVQWIMSEPTGQYARRACFLYEWLTGKRLDYIGVTSGNYHSALGEEYFVATEPVNNPRWRIRDDMPGTPNFCPLIRRTQAIRDVETFNCAAEIAALDEEFGTDLVMRSAVWLTIKESQASFAIEHEERHLSRIQRFADVIGRLTGEGDNALALDALTALQLEILGPDALRYGVRKSPIFVGEQRVTGVITHYIGPHWNEVGKMLAGLEAFTGRTSGRSSVVRAAAQSFGFVYIHPMIDGNGRISRFLINDILRRDGAVPRPLILPVSSTILSSKKNEIAYDDVLETVSKPLVRRYAENIVFGDHEIAEDGVEYNLHFTAYNDALHVWRYPDLTAHAEYLGRLVRETIQHEMRNEAVYLRQHRRDRERVKEVLDGPDPEIDRIIRAVRQNGIRVSNKLKSEFPKLADVDVERRIVEALGNE